MYNMQGDFLLLSTWKILSLLKFFHWWDNWLVLLQWTYSCSHPSVCNSAWVVQLSWLMRHQSGYLSPWVGQRSGHRSWNKALLWVVSVCDEYSFDVGQVGRVDSWNCESVANKYHGQWGRHGNLIAMELTPSCSVLMYSQISVYGWSLCAMSIALM